MKYPEKKSVGENLLCLSKISRLDTKSSIVKGKNWKTEKLNFFKISNFCSLKELVKKIKITDWAKIFVNHISDFAVLRIYKELFCTLKQSKNCHVYDS